MKDCFVKYGIFMTTQHHRLIILGTGPAGYTAALYAARANLKPFVISGAQPGGQLMTTTDVGNWPGGVEDLQGPDLMASMQSQVEKLHVHIADDSINSVNFSKKPFHLTSNQGLLYTCNALIIATGAQAKYLGLPSEAAFQGKGVSGCATCDGFFYRHQTVAVVGGGNTALEDAIYLSHLAKKVILIHRREIFRAEKMLQDKLFDKVKKGNIQLRLNYTVECIEGSENISHVTLKHTKTNAIEKLAIQGLFIAIGHSPNTQLFKEQLLLDKGYIVLPHRASPHKLATSTSVPGIFAAGDVADATYRQAITSAATGCMAALDAEKYLDNIVC